MKLVSRGDTTVVDAYLSPILQRYVTEVARELQHVELLFMQSNGGLTDAASFRGKDSIVSGPAGGIVGMARTAQKAGFDQVIGFDMGGTSTDVSHFAGEFEREYETQVAGVRMRAPMLAIHTVAAGGGSVLHFDGSRYRVGPDSAGADPGPACYRRGGPLTVTDANVLLGRIQPDYFPKVFGARGDAPLDAEITKTLFTELSEQITAATGDDRGPEQVAAGFVEIAVANMANAIKKISVQRGYDVTRYVLNVFGGAGGQHACAVADALGMTQVLIHPLAGVLSAYGIGLADIIAMREQAVEAPLTADLIKSLPETTGPLEHDARAEVQAEGANARQITATHRAHLRYQGTDTAVIVPVGPLEQMTAAFEAEYSRRFSFLMRDKPVIVEAVSVEVTAARQEPDGSADSPPRSDQAKSRKPRGSRCSPAALRGLGAGGPVPAGRAAARARRRRPGRHHRGTRHHRGRAGLAGRRERPRRPAAFPGNGAARPSRGGHQGRPGHARDLQQPVHVGRRTDGGPPAVHRALGQHQGAARLFVRGLRRRRRPDRQRAAHAGAPRLHGRVDQDGDQAQPAHPPRRRLRPQRPVPRRHPPPRHHRGHSRVRPGDRRRDLVLRGQPRAPRRDRGSVARVDAGRQHPGGGGGGADRQLAAGRERPAQRGRDDRAAEDGRVPVPRPGHEPGRPARPDRGQRQGHRRAAPHGGTFRAGCRPGLHGPRPAERRRGGQARHHRPARRRVRLRDGQRRRGAGRGPGPPRRPDRRDRLHRDLTPAGRQLQRPVERGHGGRAVRLPHPGRRRHPAQLRLPAAADRDHPAGHDALPAVPGRGRGGQRGDLSGRHRGAVRGAGRDGGGFGHDEQRDVRQRAVPVLRDGGQRLGRGRRLRRHRRGADQDDQLPAHRPRGARVAVPGAGGVLPDQAGQRRPGPLARRPRGYPAAAVHRADDRQHADRAPPRPGVRPGRRRAGRARPALDRAPRRHGDADAGLRLGARRTGRRVRHRDPGRGRIRTPEPAQTVIDPERA